MSGATAAEQRTAQRAYRTYMKLQADYEARVKEALQKTGGLIEAQIRRLPSETFSEEIRLGQYAERSKQIQRLLEEGWGIIGGHLDDGVQGASDIAAQSVMRYTDLMIGGLKGDDVSIAQSFRAAAESAVQNVQSRFINDIDLSPRIWGNESLASGQLDDIINHGILSGESAAELADDSLNYLLPDTPGGMSFSAMRMARTEINNAFHTTQTRAFDQSPLVENVQWNLSDSHPRDDECDDYANNNDGLGDGVFAASDVPGKPHPQCFCYITAIMIPKGDFINGLLGGEFDDFIAEFTD